MNTTIDTQVFLSLINSDPAQAIQQRQANAVLAKLAENSEVRWVIHKAQLEELLLKTRELVSGNTLQEEDQENAEEFLNYLASLELELSLGNPTKKKNPLRRPRWRGLPRITQSHQSGRIGRLSAKREYGVEQRKN